MAAFPPHTFALLTHQSLTKFQSKYHGLPLSSPSLLQELAPLILFHAVQEGILYFTETSTSVLNAIMLWTMGSAKFCFPNNLIWKANLPMALTRSGGNNFYTECQPASTLVPRCNHRKPCIHSILLLTNQLDKNSLSSLISL